MASSASKAPLLQTLAKKTFATAPATSKAIGCKGKVEVTKLSNKTTVASLGCETRSLVKVAVAFRSGSRYECPENFGVSHILRSSTGLSTADATSFYICRSLQQIGATLTATSDRETVVYHLESHSSNIKDGLEILKKAVTGQKFQPWELIDNIPRIKVELASLPPVVKVLDLVNKAAYRGGLGNSIFVRDFNIKKIGSETLQHFVAANMVGEKAAVAGCGIPHTTLSQFADSLCLKPGSACESPASKYGGGEVRVEENYPHAHTAIAFEAAGLNHDNALAYAVLRYALGAGPSVYRGVGSGPLSNIGKNASAQAFYAGYSDAGLLGVYVVSPGKDAKCAVESVMKALKGGLSDSDICRGKAQLKSAILYSTETCQGLVDDIVGQAVLTGKVLSPSEIANQVSDISNDEVLEVFKKLQKGHKSLATIGNISEVPYLDEL